MLLLDVRVKMAEGGRFPGSGEELPKYKPAQAKNPRRVSPSDMIMEVFEAIFLHSPRRHLHSVSEPNLSALTITDYEEESEQQLELRPHLTLQSPSPPTVTWQSWNRPTTKVSVSGSTVKVSTEYRLKELSPEPTEITPEIPPELIPRSKLLEWRPKTPSVPSVAKPRNIAKELYEAKKDFFKIKQLPKEVCC